MKLLLIGDRHNNDKSPLARIDDFQRTCAEKDIEILKIAKENGCTAILQAGDFWDEVHKKLPNEYVQSVLRRWFGERLEISETINRISSMSREELEQIIDNMKDSLPMIGVAGNHDLIGGSIASLPSTTAGLMDFMGLIKIVSKDNPIILKDPDGFTVEITGTSYYSDIDRPENVKDYIIEEKKSDYHIHIVHGALTDRRPRGMSKYTLIDSIKETKADITFVGHMHTGFKTVNVDNKYIINPGAVVRLSASKAEMTRIVHVVLVEITKSGISVKDIPLKSAKPANEVLSKEHLVKAEGKMNLAEAYNSKVKSYGIKGGTTIDDVFCEIMDNEHVSDDKKNDLKKRLDAKRAKVITKITPVKDAWIESVRLENFQSHENTVLPFTPGFNVLVGKSNQGKTAVLRALTWVYKNKPSGAGTIIRNGCKWCRVTITLKNGTVISRYIETKGIVSKTDNDVVKNTYQIIYADGTVKEGNTKLLPEVQKALGYCEFTYDEKKSIDTNFMRQKDSWYLIGDGYSSLDRAKIIGALMETNAVDANIKDCETSVRSINQDIQTTEEASKKLDEEMLQYADLDERKKEIDEVSLLISKASELSQTIEELTKIRNEIQSTKEQIQQEVDTINEILAQDYNSAIHFLELNFGSLKSAIQLRDLIEQTKLNISDNNSIILGLSTISEIPNDISGIEELLNKVINLTKIRKQVDDTNRQLAEFKDLLECESNINLASETINGLQIKLANIKSAIGIQGKKADEARYSRSYTMVIAEEDNITSASSGISVASNELKKLILAIELHDKIATVIKSQAVLEKEISDNEKTAIELEDRYQRILKDIGVCPVCGQSTNQ